MASSESKDIAPTNPLVKDEKENITISSIKGNIVELVKIGFRLDESNLDINLEKLEVLAVELIKSIRKRKPLPKYESTVTIGENKYHFKLIDEKLYINNQHLEIDKKYLNKIMFAEPNDVTTISDVKKLFSFLKMDNDLITPISLFVYISWMLMNGNINESDFTVRRKSKNTEILTIDNKILTKSLLIKTDKNIIDGNTLGCLIDQMFLKE